MATNEEVMILFKGVDNVSPVTNKIKHGVNDIGTSATGIRGKIQSVASSFDFVSSAITGVLGGMSLLDQATKMWEASTARQTQQFYLAANIGTSKAREMQSEIQRIVASVPGDDTFMNQLMTTSLAQNTQMTTKELKNMANVAADYMAGSKMMGKMNLESQQDIYKYLLDGNTAELERGSIVSTQVDKLKDKATVQERIVAMEKALKDMSFSGIAGYDTAANKLEEFHGQIEKAYADLGSMFLPIEQSVIQGFLDINDSVGGSLSTVLVGAATGASAVATGIGSIGATFTGLNSMIEFFSGLKTVLFGTQAAEEALTTATTVSTTATEAQTSVTSLLAESQMAASLAEAGLTEAEVTTMASMYGATAAMESKEVATAALSAANMEAIAAEAGLTEAELGSALAHASNIPVIEAEGVAATASSGGFFTLAGAIWSAVWPVLAVVAAVALIAVAFEQLGEWLGWWTDFGTMLDSIKAGIMRLWDAFMNSRIVQKTIEGVQFAFAKMQQVIQPIVAWLGSVWNELFNGEGAGSGGPDAIGGIIQAFTVLEDVVMTVGGALYTFWSTVFSILSPIFDTVKAIGTVIMNMFAGNTSFTQGILTIANLIANLERYIFAVMVQIGKNILDGIGNGLKKVIPMMVQFIGQLVVSFVQWQLSLSQKARQIGLSILNGIINFVRTIPTRIVNFLIMIVTYVKSFQIRLGMEARRIGLLIRDGIINFIRTLPTRVANFFKQIPGRIRSATSAAISAAANFASSVVNTVKQGFAGLVDTVYKEFMSIPDKIRSAVSAAVSAATDFGSGIKDAVLQALHIASPGIIQRKIAIEFADIPGRISESTGKVYGAAQDYATHIVQGVKSIPTMPENNLVTSNPITTSNHKEESTTVIHVHEGAVQLDARNLTTQEAKQILINAIEGLKGYNPNGGVS